MYKKIILGKGGGKNNCKKSFSFFFLYSWICLMYPTLGSSPTLIFYVYVCVCVCVCVCMCVLSCFSHVPSSRGSSWPRDQTCVSCLLHRQAGSLPRTPPVITDTVACQLLLFLLLETLYLFTHITCSWVIPTWFSELSSCFTILWHSYLLCWFQSTLNKPFS